MRAQPSGLRHGQLLQLNELYSKPIDDMRQCARSAPQEQYFHDAIVTACYRFILHTLMNDRNVGKERRDNWQTASLGGSSID